MSQENGPKRPSHVAYQVSEGQEGKSYFNKVGAAFAHKDGKGYNLILEAVPVDGRVTMRTPKDRVDEMRGKGDNGGRKGQERREARDHRDDEYER